MHNAAVKGYKSTAKDLDPHDPQWDSSQLWGKVEGSSQFSAALLNQDTYTEVLSGHALL